MVLSLPPPMTEPFAYILLYSPPTIELYSALAPPVWIRLFVPAPIKAPVLPVIILVEPPAIAA